MFPFESQREMSTYLKERYRTECLPFFGALVMAVAIAGCGGTESSGQQDIAFATVVKSQNSGVSESLQVSVRDASGWSVLWSKHTQNVQPPPALPPVDFSRYELAAVFLGPRPSGCHGVEIQRVIQQADTRVVEYKELLPGPTALCTAQAVQPAHIVSVPKGSLPVVFKLV